MAKRHHRLLSALLAAVLMSTSAATASATTVGVADSGAGSLSSYYWTNRDGLGKEKTITVDGEIGDWDDSMKIAQGTANDDPRVYRPNSMYEVPLDLYALYGAYDDSNIYLMWEMTNVQDVVAPNDDYPLSQGILYQTMNIPFFIALDTGKSDVIGNGGKTAAGTIWDSGITFGSTNFNRLVAISTNGANGPFVYAGDSSGLNAKEISAKAETGIVFKYGLGINSKNVYGLDGAYGATSMTNPRTIGDMCDDSGKWVDFNTMGHKSASMDFHYEMSIPYSTLGISKSDVTSSGVGALVIMTSGKSGMDCLPYDLSMNDKADLDDSAGSQENNSFEKSDEDDITCAFARIGSGTVNPQPQPQPQPVDSDTSTEVVEPDTSSEVSEESDTDTPPVQDDTDTQPIGWQVLPLTKQMSKGDVVKVQLGLADANNLLGTSAYVNYETASVELVSAKSLYSGAEVNKVSDGEVKWNVSLGDGTSGVTLSKAVPMVELTFKALKSVGDYFGASYIDDCYDYDFNDTSVGQSISIENLGAVDVPTDNPDTPATGKDTAITATASKGDTVNVKFNVDLSKVEGISNTFVYDTSLVEYVDCNKLDGVEVDATAGTIKWNCVNINSGSSVDVATFNFKAKTNVNGKIGTNTIRELYDANGNDLPYSTVKISVSVNGSSIAHEDVTADKKIEVAAKKGDRVVVTFNAQNAKNAAGIQTVLDYDKSALAYNGDAASPKGIIKETQSNGRVAWNILFDMNKKGGADLSSKSEIAVMTFVAQKDIAASDSVLAYKVVEFYDNDSNDFDADSTVSAAATVARRGEGKVPVTAKAGNYVIAECKAIDAEKALGIVEELTYDKDALTYLGYSDEMGHFDIDAATKGTVRWGTMFDAKGTDLTRETDIVLIKFAANKDISSTDDVLSYIVEEFYDIDLKDFDVSNTTMVYAHAVSDGEQFPVNPGDDTDNQNPQDTDSPKPGSDTDPGKTSDTPKPGDSDTSSDIHVDTSDTDKKVKILYGDVDDDKSVTSGDAVKVLRVSATIEAFTDELTQTKADVDEDTAITSQDSLAVLRFAVSLPTNTKAGQEAEITIKFKN